MMTQEERRVYNAAYYSEHRDKSRASCAAWREAHPDYFSAHAAVYLAANRTTILRKKVLRNAEFVEWLNNLKEAVGCQDVGPHEGRLEHHHLDPDTRIDDVSQMCGYSREKLDAEIAKCVVLCRSCHMKRHVEMRALAA